VFMLLFGAKKLPMLARGLGHGIKNFKGELKSNDESESDDS
jgi:sec-independent protein translocase protein TatA